MGDNTKNNGNIDNFDYVKSLDQMAAMRILLELCKDVNLADRIVSMARVSLSNVDSDNIAKNVFSNLNTIQVEDLWDNSGRTYGGYNEPSEVAFEMIEDELRDYLRQMKQYRDLGMKKEEKECCKGIISGLLLYGQEGNNEFHDAVPDDPYTHAENILYDWKQCNTAEDIEEVQAVYDSFLPTKMMNV